MMEGLERDQEKYLPQLQAEKDTIDTSFIHAQRLLQEEIDRVASGGAPDIQATNKYLEVHHEQLKPVKKQEKVIIPIKEHPKFNFVGKLLGPKGMTLKRLQEETGTKMAILGRGSMKDKNKEEEMRKEGGKFAHLNDDLHVHVEAFAPLPEAYRRVGHALAELNKFLMPDHNDEIRQQQMEEMMYLNGDEGNGAHPPAVPMRGRGRGAPPPGAGMGRGRGRGAAPGVGPLLQTPMARGGGVRPMRGAPGARGVPGARGMPGTRGAPTRGAHPGMRGAVAGRGAPRPSAPMGRGLPTRAPPARVVEEDGYGYGSGGGGSYEESYAGYEEQGYGESYEQGGYSSTGTGDSTQYFDYGHGSTGREDYVEEGYGQESWGQQQSYKAPTARPKPTDYRAHPYAGGSSRGGGRYQ